LEEFKEGRGFLKIKVGIIYQEGIGQGILNGVGPKGFILPKIT